MRYTICMDKIVPTFRESIFSSISDTIPDIAELGIDSILNDGFLKDIPFVRLVLSVRNTAQSIHYRNLLRQTLAFVKELNDGNLDEKKKQKYKKKIEDNPKKAEEELGRVLIILNQTVELEKSKILAKIFQEYINEEIDWGTFCEFSEITRLFFVDDIWDLKTVYDRNRDDYRFLSYGLSRLESLGLVKTTTKLIFVDGEPETEEEIELSSVGKKYYELASKALFTNQISAKS